jgi:alkylhydroperoxidase/carboxymuconolactone decarboxylase family protein
MKDTYYNPADLAKFSKITEFQKKMGDKFFSYYGEVFAEGALTVREKALIALAVSHAIQCPYCIDAYTDDSMAKGADEEQMMEAVHVAAAIRGGATLVHSTQMMNKINEKMM